MKYFIDTEFHEYHKQQKCFGIKIGKPIPTIDLISIGIISENNREYYAISKDFNVKDAWNSYQLEINKSYPLGSKYNKVYWLRDNVLSHIFKDLVKEEDRYIKEAFYHNVYIKQKKLDFNLKNFTKLINKYGKTNKLIAEEVKEFIYINELGNKYKNYPDKSVFTVDTDISFYGYYSDYDWVVFAQLFGKMIDLPKGFPMYCKDLKQMLDEKLSKIELPSRGVYPMSNASSNYKLKEIKTYSNYPKQENEHNALADAKWNKKLYEFIKTKL